MPDMSLEVVHVSVLRPSTLEKQVGLDTLPTCPGYLGPGVEELPELVCSYTFYLYLPILLPRTGKR